MKVIKTWLTVIALGWLLLIITKNVTTFVLGDLDSYEAGLRVEPT